MLTKKERLFKLKKKLFQRLKPYKGVSIPVFICGEQRSGTNFLINVLNRCNDTECYLENDNEAFYNYLLRDLDCISELINSSKAKVVIFKSISDSQNVSNFLDRFPSGKAIWTFRHYYDVVNSSLRNFHEHRKYLYYMLYEPQIAGWRLQNVTTEHFDLVKKYYNLGIDDASSRALIWYLRNSLFFQQGLDTDERVMLTQYEKLVSVPVQSFEIVFKFLNIVNNDRASDIAFSTSINKNRTPVINPEIKQICNELYRRMISYYEVQFSSS